MGRAGIVEGPVPRLRPGAFTEASTPEPVDTVMAAHDRGERRRRTLPARLVVCLIPTLCLIAREPYEEAVRLPATDGPQIDVPDTRSNATTFDGPCPPNASCPPAGPVAARPALPHTARPAGRDVHLRDPAEEAAHAPGEEGRPPAPGPGVLPGRRPGHPPHRRRPGRRHRHRAAARPGRSPRGTAAPPAARPVPARAGPDGEETAQPLPGSGSGPGWTRPRSAAGTARRSRSPPRSTATALGAGRLSNAHTPPSEDDVRAWCRARGAPERVADLIATLRAVAGMFVEWRRTERAGPQQAQDARRPLYERTHRCRSDVPLSAASRSDDSAVAVLRIVRGTGARCPAASPVRRGTGVDPLRAGTAPRPSPSTARRPRVLLTGLRAAPDHPGRSRERWKSAGPTPALTGGPPGCGSG
ncbi:transposase domain-containing protein [Streptomyces sp. CBMA123]|uniref:transposase domain-containing protein n=1 Tax=Streptomyces sp. CBMA123 TaxID=1896313 RepID=UPI0039837DF8